MTELAFDRLLGSLVKAEIDFVVVGGLALGAWGVVRGTRDLDVVVDQEPANLATLASLAESLNGRVQARDAFLSSAAAIEELLRAGERVQIETAIGPLDVVQGLPGVPEFSELRERAVEVDLFGSTVPVCSEEDLRAMKKAAGRARDVADLEALDEARGGR